MNLNLYNILKEVLSDNAKKKAKEKFKKENPTLSDTQIDYYLDIFSRKQASSVFKQKDIMQYKFSDLEKIIDKEFPKQTYNDKGEVDFKGSEDVLYNENGLLILLGDLKEKCIRYGQGYTWCISRKDQSNMFFSYRMRLNEPVFYFVFDEDRPKEDIWHAIVIYINKSGEYYVATANNPGDKKMSWSEIEEKQPKLKGLQNIFKHIPLTQRERDDYQRFNNPMSDEEYDKLSYDEKEKYIGFGHTLSAEQIEATPKALISKYVTTTTGNNLSKEIENSLSPSDQKVLRNNRLQNYNNRDDFKFKLIYYPEELTGDDLKVSGDLSLIDTPIKSLPDNLKVSGGLSLAGTPIKSLPDNLQVGGNLSLIGTAIESLPDNIQLGGSLFLSRTSIKSLPDNLKVSGSLNLRDTPIKSLPDNLQVGGDLDLDDTPITSLPDNLIVGGSLNISSTLIKSLPDNLQVGGSLFLDHTSIKYLPDNLKVRGNLDLSATPIQSLPDNLKVSGDLYLGSTAIESLPDNLQVGGSIYLNRHLTQKYGKYKIKQSEINNIKEFSNNISLTSILKDILLEAARTSKGKKVPAKYLKGLKSKGEYGSKEAMKKEIDKFAGKKEYKKDWKADFKDGKRIKTKKGAATKAFEKKFNESVIDENIDKSLSNKAAKTGVPVSILRQVYNRGKSAWNQGHRPGVAQDQWAMGRVNSFLTGVGGARKADKDLWEKAKKSKAKKKK